MLDAIYARHPLADEEQRPAVDTMDREAVRSSIRAKLRRARTR
jgi:hypothetical protein